MKFYIVDAFSKEVFGGNPAGVVIFENNESFLSADVMCKIASEVRYSETAFLKINKDNKFEIRYFTTTSEVDLCGHATIATFVVLRDLKYVQNGKQYYCDTKAGEITVSVELDGIFMSMAKPKIIDTITDENEIEKLYEVMGMDYKQAKPHDMLPKIISTGLPDIILPVENIDILNNSKVDFEKLTELSKEYNVVGVHAFAIGEDYPSVTSHCRNYAPLYEIDEESATGTANGALTYYLLQEQKITDKALYMQGETMKRPSYISARIINGQIEIGGDGVILSSGVLFI